MHTHLMRVLILAIALCATGCRTAPEISAVRTTPIDMVATKPTAVTQEMTDCTFAEKSEFVTKMQIQLDSIQLYLDQISTRIEESSDQNTNDNWSKLLTLRLQTNNLEVQLHRANTTVESTWDEVKAGLMKRYGELKYSLDSTSG